MMKINVYSEKSGNFASDSKMKPMIIIESKKKPFEPGKKDKNGKPILSLKEKYPDAFTMILSISPTVGAHTGAGTLAISYFGNKR